MNEVQSFHVPNMQAFITSQQAVPLEVGDLVLAFMQKRYGSEFNNKFDSEYGDKHALRAAMCEILAGLNQEDIQRGLLRMRHQRFCPSLSVFRELCEDWKGENEAWADAITWRKNCKHKITQLTKQAFDVVASMFIDTDNNNIAARNLDTIGYAFREVYRSLLDKAKCNNEHQEFWVPEKSDDNRNKYKPAPSPHVMETLNEQQKQIVLRIQQLVTEGKSHKEALNQARHEIYRVNINKNVELEKNRQPPTYFQEQIQQGHTPEKAFENASEERKAQNVK